MVLALILHLTITIAGGGMTHDLWAGTAGAVCWTAQVICLQHENVNRKNAHIAVWLYSKSSFDRINMNSHISSNGLETFLWCMLGKVGVSQEWMRNLKLEASNFGHWFGENRESPRFRQFDQPPKWIGLVYRIELSSPRFYKTIGRFTSWKMRKASYTTHLRFQPEDC